MPEHTEPQFDYLKTPGCHMLLLLTRLSSTYQRQKSTVEFGTVAHPQGWKAQMPFWRLNEWKSSANRLGCREGERCYNVLVVEGDIKVLHNQAPLVENLVGATDFFNFVQAVNAVPHLK